MATSASVMRWELVGVRQERATHLGRVYVRIALELDEVLAQGLGCLGEATEGEVHRTEQPVRAVIRDLVKVRDERALGGFFPASSRPLIMRSAPPHPRTR